jgi:hypothetical protein
MCLSFVTVEDKFSDKVICPTCNHPQSVEEQTPDSPPLPKNQPNEYVYKILVPLIYVVIFLPLIFAVYYFVISADKHAPVEDKGTTTEKEKPRPAPKPKPKPRSSSSEKAYKDSLISTPRTPILDESNQDKQ